ncbi:efflux RND transporter periplasmic adaptor subunit [Heliobacterium gestii]|uniref:Efflux RND transporter periplasmic adaptor subunit n=1 Tax=Heliomicrobium gestii TaxID=2699 RepID=A0A845L8N3_HELGE|nr:efflux RND transporter periplasmic adaptor subunit [Heliomicrobium gestii]MBM7865313.1 multidrug efflux pump subunit AcrA (membrane-fusion protein) [Heliomicrobium gestii]MZP41574.1 efflux RND transporter periplasmic adaptor subunit [Heliomicrobium gestii]
MLKLQRLLPLRMGLLPRVIVLLLATLPLLAGLYYLLPSPPEVITVTVDQGAVQKDLWISGEVKAKRQNTLFSSLPGPIEWIVDEGQRVNEGEPVARIAGQPLTTPIAGQLMEKKVPTGSWVPPGTPLAEVADPTDLVIQAMVDETDVLKLTPDQPVRWTLAGYPGQSFSGKVLTVSRVVSRDHEGNKGFRILLSAPPGITLYAGMTAEGRVILEQRDEALRISVDALWEQDGKPQVYLLRKGRAVTVSVETGLRDDNYAQILSGLQAGDRVIIPGGAKFTSGQSVRLKEPTKAEAGDKT